MNTFFRNKIVYLITFTVLITIGLQVYWNISNYQTNKQRIINLIQIALDNSIDSYYNDIAKRNIAYYDPKKSPFIMESRPLGNSKNAKFYKANIQSDISKQKSNSKFMLKYTPNDKNTQIRKIEDIQELAEKIIIATRQDSVNLNKIARNLNHELERKNLDLEFALLYTKEHKYISHYREPENIKYVFSTISKSAFLPQNSTVKLFFPNIFFKTLKEGMIGIILSLVLSLSIILCLFYLLYIIRQQKQLAIIKNDFISNISHELKTPIAVVTSALEAIEKFNTANEPEKTKKYLTISNQHLTKLNQIVEKILETSILESDKLQLQKENTNITELIIHNIEKLQFNTEKKILFHFPEHEIWIKVDTFHFENVISNLIDNAIKYGGNEITITLKKEDDMVLIFVSDNGPGIDKLHRSKIFDKFYRIPQHNQHDQKGFGIGLYYSRNIIIKHSGTLTLTSEELTTFKISIPNEPED